MRKKRESNGQKQRNNDDNKANGRNRRKKKLKMQLTSQIKPNSKQTQRNPKTTFAAFFIYH